MKVKSPKKKERADSITCKYHHEITTAIVQEEISKRSKPVKHKQLYFQKAQKSLESLIDGTQAIMKDLKLQNSGKQGKKIQKKARNLPTKRKKKRKSIAHQANHFPQYSLQYAILKL